MSKPNNRGIKAWCYASGHIRFGSRVPIGALFIASGPAVRKVVSVLARHAYDNKTLLVPGIPEAPDQAAKLVAWARFCNEVDKRMHKRRERAA